MIDYKNQDKIKRLGDFSACMRVNDKWGEMSQKWLMSRPLGSMCRPETIKSWHILKRVWKFSKLNYICGHVQAWVNSHTEPILKFSENCFYVPTYTKYVSTHEVQKLKYWHIWIWDDFGGLNLTYA